MRKLSFLCAAFGLIAIAGCYNGDAPVSPNADFAAETAALATAAPENNAAEIAALKERMQARRQQHRLTIERMGGGRRLATVLPMTHVVPDDFATIQAAVNAANPGDKILVKDKGTAYVEFVFVATDSLKITGEGNPTVAGGFDIDGADGVKIEYFTIDSDVGGAAIEVLESDDLHITGNTITNIDGEGIRWTESDNIFIRHNSVDADDESLEGFDSYNARIFWNTVTGQSDGIEVSNTGDKIFGNIVTDCGRDGIDLNGGSNYNVHMNHVSGSVGNGIGLIGVTESKIGPDNVLDGNNIGINIRDSDNNLILENHVCKSTTDDIVDNGTDNRLINNKLSCP